MRIRLVMFDLDGTLVDSAPGIAWAVNEVLRHESLPELPLESIRGFIGDGARASVARAYVASERLLHASAESSGAVDTLLLDRLMSIYARLVLAGGGARSRLYAGVHWVIDALRARAVKVALVTNKEACFVGPLLAAHGLLDCFEPMLCGDTLPVRKPDAWPLRRCLAHHCIAPEHAVMVGDSAIDVRAARAAGVRSLLVTHGYQATGPCTPDAWLHSLRDLIEYVDRASHACSSPSSLCGTRQCQ